MTEYPVPPKELRYVPASLGEVRDMIGGMVLGAPRFGDTTGLLPWRTIHTEFESLTDGFEVVRKKLGEERYAALMDLALRAKALFLDDQDDTNGKTDQGRDLLFEMENIVLSVRKNRVAVNELDEDGEITGD